MSPDPVDATLHSLYAHLTFEDCLHRSHEGSSLLRLGRDGFTYGETALDAVSQVLDAVDLPSYRCLCRRTMREHRDGHGQRCARCGHRGGGAAIVDLGSGVV